jgi:ATP-dependent Zn protease
MSGADLANLVNEAALHAVRRESLDIAMIDFESARDRVLLGQRRESLVLSDGEKERIAYHEGGHALLAYVLDHADPVHKVTILPTGMALGVTHPLAGLHRGFALCPHGWTSSRTPRLWRPLNGCLQRPSGQHRAGPQNGP